MINYADSFGRDTIVEIRACPWNKSVGYVIRKERQSVAESWDLATAEKIALELTKTIQRLKDEIEATA